MPARSGDRWPGRDDRRQIRPAAQAEGQVAAVTQVADGRDPTAQRGLAGAAIASMTSPSWRLARLPTGSALASKAKWTWASTSPGSRVAPGRSITVPCPGRCRRSRR